MATVTRRWFAALASPAVLLAPTACGTTGLEDEDPAGHQACTTYMTTTHEDLAGDDVLVVAIGSNSVAAEHALDSTTPEIKAAAEESSYPEHNLYLADVEALVAACMDHGYEVAEFSAEWWREQSN